MNKKNTKNDRTLRLAAALRNNLKRRHQAKLKREETQLPSLTVDDQKKSG